MRVSCLEPWSRVLILAHSRQCGNTASSLATEGLALFSKGAAGVRKLRAALQRSDGGALSGDWARARAQARRDAASASAFADSLAGLVRRSQGLLVLDVGVDLGSRGWKSLASALAANTSLRTISLAGSRLGDASMASVASGLGATTGFVQQLCLSDCALTARGASAAADIIKAQAARRASAEWATSLRSPCDPRGRTIVTSGEGCSAMFEAAPGVANAIDDAEGLRVLDLSFNAIGESGVVALVTSMQFGSQVVALDLRSNGLPFRVEADMQELLVAAPTLASVDLRENEPDEETGKEMGIIGKHIIELALDANTDAIRKRVTPPRSKAVSKAVSAPRRPQTAPSGGRKKPWGGSTSSRVSRYGILGSGRSRKVPTKTGSGGSGGAGRQSAPDPAMLLARLTALEERLAAEASARAELQQSVGILEAENALLRATAAAEHLAGKAAPMSRLGNAPAEA